jgi:hypothetical protein
VEISERTRFVLNSFGTYNDNEGEVTLARFEKLVVMLFGWFKRAWKHRKFWWSK